MRYPGRLQTVRRYSLIGAVAAAAAAGTVNGAQAPAPSAPGTDDTMVITATACTLEKLGATIPVENIGEPVRRVVLATAAWTAETTNAPGYCRVDGVMEPIDTSASARPINYAVALPARWTRRNR